MPPPPFILLGPHPLFVLYPLPPLLIRNCLVSRMPPRFGPDQLHAQLCDSALSRDLFPDDYALPLPLMAEIRSEEEAEEMVEPRPIRWMAPELLEAASSPALPPPPPRLPSLPLLHPSPSLPLPSPPLPFSSASDIWAFGVLLWELFTCAQLPYAELGPEEVVQVELFLINSIYFPLPFIFRLSPVPASGFPSPITAPTSFTQRCASAGLSCRKVII